MVKNDVFLNLSVFTMVLRYLTDFRLLLSFGLKVEGILRLIKMRDVQDVGFKKVLSLIVAIATFQ